MIVFKFHFQLIFREKNDNYDSDDPFACWNLVETPFVTVTNQKLRYREEHSASVVLSWCTLWHLSGDKQQINS